MVRHGARAMNIVVSWCGLVFAALWVGGSVGGGLRGSVLDGWGARRAVVAASEGLAWRAAWLPRSGRRVRLPALRLRPLVAPLGHQALALGVRSGGVARLDMAVATNLLRYPGNFQGQVQVLRRQRWQQFLDAASIFNDERGVAPALLRVAEGVEGRAAQALEPCQDAQRTAHPRAVLALERFAVALLPGEHRRCQVVH